VVVVACDNDSEFYLFRASDPSALGLAGDHQAYKEWMKKRLEYEQWENGLVLYKKREMEGNTAACEKILAQLNTVLGYTSPPSGPPSGSPAPPLDAPSPPAPRGAPPTPSRPPPIAGDMEQEAAMRSVGNRLSLEFDVEALNSAFNDLNIMYDDIDADFESMSFSKPSSNIGNTFDFGFNFSTPSTTDTFDFGGINLSTPSTETFDFGGINLSTPSTGDTFDFTNQDSLQATSAETSSSYSSFTFQPIQISLDNDISFPSTTTSDDNLNLKIDMSGFDEFDDFDF